MSVFVVELEKRQFFTYVVEAKNEDSATDLALDEVEKIDIDAIDRSGWDIHSAYIVEKSREDAIISIAKKNHGYLKA